MLLILCALYPYESRVFHRQSVNCRLNSCLCNRLIMSAPSGKTESANSVIIAFSDTFQNEIAEFNLPRRKVFFLKCKIQMMRHRILDRKREQPSRGDELLDGDFRNHRDAHACGNEIFDRLGVVDRGYDLQLNARQMLLHPAQEFLLKRGGTASGNQRLLAEHRFREHFLRQPAEALLHSA